MSCSSASAIRGVVGSPLSIRRRPPRSAPRLHTLRIPVRSIRRICVGLSFFSSARCLAGRNPCSGPSPRRNITTRCRVTPSPAQRVRRIPSDGFHSAGVGRCCRTVRSLPSRKPRRSLFRRSESASSSRVTSRRALAHHVRSVRDREKIGAMTDLLLHCRTYDDERGCDRCRSGHLVRDARRRRCCAP